MFVHRRRAAPRPASVISASMVRAAYLQSWGGPDSPLTWRLRKNQAGCGSLGDLMAHIIDMARFVTGDEIAEVGGAIEERFIKQRPRPDDYVRGKRVFR